MFLADIADTLKKLSFPRRMSTFGFGVVSGRLLAYDPGFERGFHTWPHQA
jgi:hypothetical protein